MRKKKEEEERCLIANVCFISMELKSMEIREIRNLCYKPPSFSLTHTTLSIWIDREKIGLKTKAELATSFS